jgi:hypothetical protein
MSENFTKIIESAITKMGLDPKETQGEESGQWQLFRGAICIFIDVWKPSLNSDWNYTGTEHAVNTFQVIAPITELPLENKLFQFYEELLHMNFHLYKASLIVNRGDNVLAVKYKSIIAGLTETEVIEAVESVGYYAEMLAEYYSKNYGVKKLSE